MDKSIEGKRFNLALFIAFSFIALLWLIWVMDTVLGLQLWQYGVIPRTIDGLPGILTSAFIHGDAGHIFSNTLPLLILLTLLFNTYHRVAFPVLLLIWIADGAGVWFFARGMTSHIGASGIVYGLTTFLFFSGLVRWEVKTLVISALVVFLYGSSIWGVLPLEEGISWESHLVGAITGMALAFVFMKKGPQPPPEIEEEEKENADELNIDYHFIPSEQSQHKGEAEKDKGDGDNELDKTIR
jgi:membrane associated rhomboid family serine protease